MTRPLLSPSSGAPLRVLVVEDSVADAELLADVLDEELPGVVVRSCTSLAEATRVLGQEDRLDVVVTDLSLPDAEGLEALTAVRAVRQDVAVVVLTGHEDRELALAALAAGAEDYLVKGARDGRAVATAVLFAAQRRRTEEEARRYERLALALLDAMEAATCAVDEKGDVIAVNRAWEQLTGGVPRTAYASFQTSLGQDAQTAAQVLAGLAQVLDGFSPRVEHDYAWHGLGDERWVSLRINPLPHVGAVLTHVDVTTAMRAQRALSHLSLHDPLTDLPNRGLLVDRLEQALAAAHRDEQRVAVAYLDLDHFKKVNDTLGHAAGDELLRGVARRLSAALRDGDTLSRLSGDEFAVVWPALASAEQAEQLAHRLFSAFEEPFRVGATDLLCTASVGVALGAWPQGAEDLLLAADAAMYDAKGHGRGRTRLYTDELRQGVEARQRTEDGLRQALVEGELVLHYQPVVDLRRGVVTGVEALVRWRTPEGLRLPDTFIPVAEATRLVVPLGAWVLQQACRQAVAWEDAGLRLQVAVNVSARQVGHPGMLGTLQEALAGSGLAASRLMVEVTESTVMEDAEQAQVALGQIAALGVPIAIDDFGTGYSSLLYLKRYPIHALKIDRSFVAGMGENEDDDAIVASVVSLARAVGALCIAEGVETEAQHAALRALGCDHAQGFLFGRPVPADDLPDALRACEELLARPLPPSRPAQRAPTAVLAPATLARLEQLHLDGASLHTITAALNREEHRAPSGGRWHSLAVARAVAALRRRA